MDITHDEQTRVTRLLTEDVTATLGTAHVAIVETVASQIRDLDLPSSHYEQAVVDEVQQSIHDTFVQTTWPACPRHPNHPLWFRDGVWRCERDGQAVAALGALGSVNPAGR